MPSLNSKFLPLSTKLGQGYVFTRVCDSVHSGGVSISVPGRGLHPGGVISRDHESSPRIHGRLG